MTGCAAVPVAETFVENSFVALLRLKICASLRKLLSTESDFSRQDAKPQSSEIFPFLFAPSRLCEKYFRVWLRPRRTVSFLFSLRLCVFAPLREVFPSLVAATPHRILR